MATIKAGTYVFKSNVSLPTSTITIGTTAILKSYYLTANNTYIDTPVQISSWDITSSQVSIILPGGTTIANSWITRTYDASAGQLVEYTATDTTKLRTIIAETDQTVSDDFYTWFSANIITTSKLSVDLTTLPGWANLSSGNHVIKLKAKGSNYRDSELSEGVTVSKAASTVTLEKGTYKFVDNPTLPTPAITEDFLFMSSNDSFDKLIVNINRRIVYSFEGDILGVYYNNAWVNTAYQTITLDTAQTVSAEFYKWAITDGNLVKQAGYTLTLQLMAFQQDVDPSNAYIKINSDTVSSTDYDYMIQGSPSSIFNKNGERVDASSAIVITGVYKVAWRGAYSAYLIGEDTPQIVGSQYTLSTYELSGDTTLQIRYEYSGSLSSPANAEEPTI